MLLWFSETQQETIQSAIINKTKLDKMTVSKALKKLTLENLVEREEYTEDTRVTLVSLTKKGQVLIKKLMPIIEKIDQYFSGISRNKQFLVISCLNELVLKNNE